MDLALFFVLPLIGGFVFVTDFELLRYRTIREDSQRLYYRAAFWSLIFAVIAGLLHWLAEHVPMYAGLVGRLNQSVFMPLFERERAASALPLSAAASALRADVALVCVYALVLGGLVPLWNALLKLVDRLRFGPQLSWGARVNRRAITDELESLLARSLIEARAVQLTIGSGKVYVGNVVETLEPSSTLKYVRILPIMSGQRDTSRGTVDYTTFYDDVISLGADEENVRSFELVIPVEQVVTASGFDFDAFERFLEQKEAFREPPARLSPVRQSPRISREPRSRAWTGHVAARRRSAR